MGPRPFSRGNPMADSTGAGLSRASMGPRPFSRGNSLNESRAVPARKRFNGAATFQSRKHKGRSTRRCVAFRLQWGRDLSVAETIVR